MFPPVKAESPERHARSPPRNTPTETSDPTLWPEMYVKPIWLTMTMLGGRSIESIVESQMLTRLYKILGEGLLDHADMLGAGRYEEHVEFIEEYFVGCEVQYGLQNPEVQATLEAALGCVDFAILIARGRTGAPPPPLPAPRR